MNPSTVGAEAPSLALTPREGVAQTYLPRIEAAVREAAQGSCGASSTLITMVDYQMATGGKRMRALLPLLVAEALGVSPDPLIPFAAACEVLHNATLVHDDIQDGDRRRRGCEAAWCRFGVARAINLGDAMLFLAVALAQRVPLSDAARLAASGRLVKAALSLVDGQDLELVQRSGERGGVPRRDDYAALAVGKTSSLFSLPLAGAAELCGMAPAGVTALEEVARDLGVLFQIQDDVLDLHGDKGRDLPRSDLYEGKRSFLVVAACERLAPVAIRRLVYLLDIPRDEKTEADVEAIAALLDEAGALGAALDEIRRLRARVIDAAPQALAGVIASTVDAMLLPIAELYRTLEAA